MGVWLRRIAGNVCVDLIRRNKVRQTSAADVESVAKVDDRETSKTQREELVGFIQDLPEPLAEVIFLHYYDDMTYDEMAQWLGVARSTVNERLSKARKQLKQKIDATGGQS